MGERNEGTRRKLFKAAEERRKLRRRPCEGFMAETSSEPGRHRLTFYHVSENPHVRTLKRSHSADDKNLTSQQPEIHSGALTEDRPAH